MVRLRPFNLGYADTFLQDDEDTMFNFCSGSYVCMGIKESTWVYDSETSDILEVKK